MTENLTESTLNCIKLSFFSNKTLWLSKTYEFLKIAGRFSKSLMLIDLQNSRKEALFCKGDRGIWPINV